MTVFLIVLGVLGFLILGVTLALYAVKVDRALVARAEIQAWQRRSEAEMQHVVQDTIAHMFDAARKLR